MAILALLLLSLPVLAQDSATVCVAPHEKDRRWVVVESGLKAEPPFHVVDETGNQVFSQIEGGTVRLLVPAIVANRKARFTVTRGPSNLPTLTVAEDPGGWLSVKGPDREITRYHTGALAGKHKKPFLYPLVVQGVNVLRGYPMEERQGEAQDHPHQTGIYHAFGEVNGKDYWMKVPITPRRILEKDAGPVCARIVAENGWGEDLIETQEIRILNAGADAVIDFTITLKAENGPVIFAKDLKMAKEGSFAARLAAGLSVSGRGEDAPAMITDSKGGKGEKAVRAGAAPWIHYGGEVDGKKVGIAIMNHPSSFRYPGDWHVRAYGLFAANPWIVRGEHTLAKGESLTLGYRVYVHGGDFDAGRVADVFAGYTNAKVSVDRSR